LENWGIVFEFHFEAELPSRVLFCLTSYWTSIQVKKGFYIRILHFNPDNVFLDLIDFANANGICISKTKDYLILEK
jgi:hypothetical protein